MDEAVKKHGKIELQSSHIDEFYKRIDGEREKIVSRA